MGQVVLASSSRARARLLADAGLSFEVDPPLLDESPTKKRMRARGADAAELAEALAEAKARERTKHHPGTYVIGADQVLELDGKWYDKPKTREEAADHLRTFRGRTHHLVSAVCVVRDNDRIWRHVETARLKMRMFSEDFLFSYLDQAGDEYLESVGAYRLEGMGSQLFSRIDGNHFTILGLPLLSLLRFLRREGVLLD